MTHAARPSSAQPPRARTPHCAACDHTFGWDEARVDPGTARTGAVPRAPQLHCPRCDASVVQWHLDLVSDHASWVWSHGQVLANLGVDVPSDPPHRWAGVPTQRPHAAHEDVSVP